VWGEFCTDSWGTSDPCTLNYNVHNQFCCRCEPPTFVLGAAGANCDQTCATEGLPATAAAAWGPTAARTPTCPECSDPESWIYQNGRYGELCTDSWGTSDVCSDNYNRYNQFCCRCR
jgi:hypothetical protein